jgi:hypothetical protein
MRSARRWSVFGLLAVALVSSSSFAQTRPSADLPPAELVRQTIQNEIRSSRAIPISRFMFQSRKQGPQGSQTKLYVETSEGMAGMVVANNDKPLSAEQRAAENARVQRFIDDPSELEKKKKREKEDADRTLQIMKALPDAFLYAKDGTQAGSQNAGKTGDELVRLKFWPNPQYTPPSHTEQVLVGMQGHLLIDAEHFRLAEIDGTLFREVSFGWGILGHLDKGGHFLVNQAEVGSGEWEITRMSLGFTGKIMMFKTLHIQSDEVFSSFRTVPANLTFAQGVGILKKQQSELAENHASDGGSR